MAGHLRAAGGVPHRLVVWALKGVSMPRHAWRPRALTSNPRPRRMRSPRALLAFADRHRWWLFAASPSPLRRRLQRAVADHAGQCPFMELGRDVAEGKGFVYHGVRHNWYEPGLPYVIGLSFRWFGADNYVPLTLFVLACGMLSLVLAYHLFRLHAGRPTAVLLTVLLAVTETFYRYCFQIVTDAPFLVGLMAFLLGYEAIVGRGTGRQWWAWALIPAGTLVMCASARRSSPSSKRLGGWRRSTTLSEDPVASATPLFWCSPSARSRLPRCRSPASFPGEAAHREATLRRC